MGWIHKLFNWTTVFSLVKMNKNVIELLLKSWWHHYNRWRFALCQHVFSQENNSRFCNNQLASSLKGNQFTFLHVVPLPGQGLVHSSTACAERLISFQSDWSVSLGNRLFRKLGLWLTGYHHHVFRPRTSDIWLRGRGWRKSKGWV